METEVKSRKNDNHLTTKEANRLPQVIINNSTLANNPYKIDLFLSVLLDHQLTFRKHIESLKAKINVTNNVLRCLEESTLGGGNTHTS